MATITMRVRISGTRNGADWPQIGGTVDVPDDEANHLIAVGHAYPGTVTVDGRGNRTEPAPEQATPPAPETTTRKAPAKRSAKATATAAAKATESE